VCGIRRRFSRGAKKEGGRCWDCNILLPFCVIFLQKVSSGIALLAVAVLISLYMASSPGGGAHNIRLSQQ
jgi:hypothetical protein